jgi:transposase
MSEARIIRADRTQPRFDVFDLEALLPHDHKARVVWAFVESLDIEALYESIKSREGGAGRPAADPRVLLALWIYATVEGVGSARQLERLAEREVAFRWLAGAVPLNYHGLADFRVDHVEVLDRLLTQSVTALVSEGLVSLRDIAVDGTKIRARASKKSFRRRKTLRVIEAAVSERLVMLKKELEDDPASSSRRERAAKERAAREVGERARRAIAAVERLAAEREARKETHKSDEAKKSEPKASLSDPQARQMRFADGAVRPGYNAQIAAAPVEGVIVAIEVTDRRNDAGLAEPMVDEIVRRYGQAPDNLLVDTGYATAEDIESLSQHPAGPVTVFTPVPAMSDDVKPETLRRREAKLAREADCLKAWRERMASPQGRAAYAQRKQIERINAERKNHGFGILAVRGLIKAQAVALWHAIAHNFTAGQRLRARAA